MREDMRREGVRGEKKEYGGEELEGRRGNEGESSGGEGRGERRGQEELEWIGRAAQRAF